MTPWGDRSHGFIPYQSERCTFGEVAANLGSLEEISHSQEVIGVADIIGSYAMNWTPGYQRLEILRVNAGQLVDAHLIDDDGDKRDIHGTYNDVTNQIAFNDAWFPGNVFNTTFFTGLAIVVPDSTYAFALAGTWHALKVHIPEPGRILRLERETGSWYADCKQAFLR
jgi:hypothetical protein